MVQRLLRVVITVTADMPSEVLRAPQHQSHKTSEH